MPNILNSSFFKTKPPRELRMTTPGEFAVAWLGWMAALGLLYFGAFRLGVLPRVLRMEALRIVSLGGR